MTNAELKSHMQRGNACEDATEWVGDRTPEQAFTDCPNPYWLLWALVQAGNQPLGISMLTEAMALYGCGEETYQAWCDYIRRQPKVREAFRSIGVNLDG